MARRSVAGEELLQRIRSLKTWKRGGVRAPHKPLLLLLALGRIEQGKERLARFEDLEEPLQRLLKEFGPPRDRYAAEYPFWYLRSAGLWEVTNAEQLRLRRAGSNPPRTELLARDVEGGLTGQAFELLRDDAALRRRVARELLETHFPPSLHEEILDEVGLSLALTATRSARDPEFRLRVLRAYSRSCAVCGFDAHLSSGPFGLDAAHVRWKEAGGPDVVENGVCLCVLHHRAFDRGVFTIDERYRVLVSQDLAGHVGAEEHFWKHHEREMRPPQAGHAPPEAQHLHWHRREVFRGPARGEREAG